MSSGLVGGEAFWGLEFIYPHVKYEGHFYVNQLCITWKLCSYSFVRHHSALLLHPYPSTDALV